MIIVLLFVRPGRSKLLKTYTTVLLQFGFAGQADRLNTLYSLSVCEAWMPKGIETHQFSWPQDYNLCMRRVRKFLPQGGSQQAGKS